MGWDGVKLVALGRQTPQPTMPVHVHLQLLLQLGRLSLQGPALLQYMGEGEGEGLAGREGQSLSRAEEGGEVHRARSEGQYGSFIQTCLCLEGWGNIWPHPSCPTHKSLQLQKGGPLCKTLLPLMGTE